MTTGMTVHEVLIVIFTVVVWQLMQQMVLMIQAQRAGDSIRVAARKHVKNSQKHSDSQVAAVGFATAELNSIRRENEGHVQRLERDARSGREALRRQSLRTDRRMELSVKASLLVVEEIRGLRRDFRRLAPSKFQDDPLPEEHYDADAIRQEIDRDPTPSISKQELDELLAEGGVPKSDSSPALADSTPPDNGDNPANSDDTK